MRYAFLSVKRFFGGPVIALNAKSAEENTRKYHEKGGEHIRRLSEVRVFQWDLPS
jgi:hypothetical protein